MGDYDAIIKNRISTDIYRKEITFSMLEKNFHKLADCMVTGDFEEGLKVRQAIDKIIQQNENFERDRYKTCVICNEPLHPYKDEWFEGRHLHECPV